MPQDEKVEGIFLAVDGEPVPIAECDWLQIASCGCVSGVTVAGLYGCRVASADEARAEFNENAVEYKRSIEDGFTYRAIRHSDFRKEWGPGIDCTHSPKYGVRRAIVPEGHEWATTDSGFGRQTHLKHLVPSESVRQFEGAYIAGEAVALCGKKAHGWEGLTFFTGVTCRRCEKAAGYEGGAS